MKKSKTIREIPLNEIILGENYRQPQKIEQIAISLKSQGQLEPILVIKKEQGYIIINGYRRYHGMIYANKSLGADFKFIDAILIDDKMQTEEKDLLQLVLNEHLSTPLEKAIKITELIENGMQQRKIAEAFGINEGYVSSLKKKIVPDEIFRAYITNGVIIRMVDKENKRAYYGINQKSFEKILSEKPEIMRTTAKIEPGTEKINLNSLDSISEVYYKLKELDKVFIFQDMIARFQLKKIYDKKRIDAACVKILNQIDGQLKEKSTKDKTSTSLEVSNRITKIFKKVKFDESVINRINQTLTEENIPIVISLKKP